MIRVWFFRVTTIITEHSAFQFLAWLSDRALSPLNIEQLDQAKLPPEMSSTRVPPVPTTTMSGPIALFAVKFYHATSSRYTLIVARIFLHYWPNNKSRFGHFCIACACVG